MSELHDIQNYSSSPNEQQSNCIPQALFQQADRYSFFQAMREIEVGFSKLPRIGSATSPMHEAFRIHQPADLAFAPNTIDSAKNGDGKVVVEQRFFGLLGPSGPLPLHLTEIVRNRDRHAGDKALQAFLDLFHHRMASLFYRAWSSAKPVVQRDRPAEDRFLAYLGSLAGVESHCSFQQDAWSIESKSYFAGHLGSCRRTAEGLAALIRSIIDTQVVVQPFALRWLQLSKLETTRLGGLSNRAALKLNTNRLGRTAVLGERVPDRQSLVEVRLGPMSFAEFESLLPGSDNCKKLQAVMRTHAGTGVDARIRPVLSKEEVPRLQLGRVGQLGRSTWIHGATVKCDRDDYFFNTNTTNAASASELTGLGV